SELLLASIEQRSSEMDQIPFTRVIRYRENAKYLKYLAIPLVVVALLWLSGSLSSFLGSYQRVVRYSAYFEPPAPFEFKVIADGLEVLENETVRVKVFTVGDVQPEDVYAVVNDKEILLSKADSLYELTFTPPLQSSTFFFKANEVESRRYELKALKTPGITDFSVQLDYPDYTGKRADILRNTGNATIPEGTRVAWSVSGKNANMVHLVTNDSSWAFQKEESNFTHSSMIFSTLPYQITSSNENISHFERLGFVFKVIKDGFPGVKVRQLRDSLQPNISYYSGEATDDYKIKSIQLVCYPRGKEDQKQRVALLEPDVNFQEFYYTFPSGLELEKAQVYELYFEVRDNDPFRGGKVSKSQVFTSEIFDEVALEEKRLDKQQDLIEQMNKAVDQFKENTQELDEIQQQQKEKTSLNFNDKSKVSSFLKKQQQQQELMKKFSNELKQNLEQDELDDTQKKLLQERMEREELKAQKNAKLLEELQKVADKINKDDLAKRLEELGKSQQNSQKSLDQLLELTKRYYVTEKASQLAQDLEKLAEEQEAISQVDEGNKSEKETQERFNREFDTISQELQELEKDNDALKKPMDLNIDEKKSESVKQDQKEALEEYDKEQGNKESDDETKPNEQKNKLDQKQRSAARKMKEMSESLSQSGSSMGGGSSIAEDAEMLRQILDNLVTFSFKQEELLDVLSESEGRLNDFGGVVREQQQLKELFEHVDDSLFALSLRRAELSEFVNEQITEVYYNIDKTLGSVSENRIFQGASYQQYVLTASNNLADYLASILDNMQQSMSMGSGEGSGDSFQLPDIIQSQSELKEKMGKMQGEGKQGQQEGESQEGQSQGDQKGNEGKEGKEGQKGEGRENGENGSQGSEGDSGKGDKEGDGNSEGSNGNSEESEEDLRELFEIYKEQQRIRQELEKQLEDMIENGDRDLAKKLLRQMESFEEDLLENGITQRTIQRMNMIEHQLLKLENAALDQGEKQERQSKTNKQDYANPILTRPEQWENFKRETELLNRQALPLQQRYRELIRLYFKSDD
ncbi:MAG: hypothetical protein KJO04_02815, partial [Bacteroidia bacterium]|nr:hypothetical protein [Bacteroidia bacterium]